MNKTTTALFIVSLCGGASAAVAQTQTTLGACSPAITNTKGNVNITCMLPNKRIKVAKFIDDINTNHLDSFETFLDKNDGKVVYIESSVLNYLTEPQNMRPGESIAIKNRLGGGHIFYATGPKANEALYYANGASILKGYFIPNNEIGMHQGWVSTELKHIENEKIMLSDKFETD